ncbi:putative metal-binding, possibly nucleic acid-binding protein [Fructobacillus pseudoficulneus]|uniref:Putative metal-binding, possibly nucleic acid-binding protein n=1 Tax=Fructobacillus pseudoficulneus TaxID=220714 RepID=A0A3F3H8U0_9LACO|nr:YceD family protein [Fructobacillus pseudoficulneus]GAP02989.1 putative metal-binding, possibly nucleic acid-binding protein [Fructobacillus pseudoficulneus]
MMKYAKQQLIKYRQSPLLVDQDLDLQNLIDERFSDLIINARLVHVQGTIRMLANEEIVMAVTVKADLTLPSSRSLEPVDWSTEVQIHETYVTTAEELSKFEEDEAVFVLENDSLDIDQVVLDNIIAVLPSQILTAAEEEGESLPAGKDWQGISEADFAVQQDESQEDAAKEEKTLDPRLSKLDDFFK